MPANNYFKSKYFGSNYRKSKYYRPTGTPVEDIYDPEGGPRDDGFLQDDDEVIMLVARAFLTLVN
jgi:hypothetical protein